MRKYLKNFILEMDAGNWKLERDSCHSKKPILFHCYLKSRTRRQKLITLTKPRIQKLILKDNKGQ